MKVVYLCLVLVLVLNCLRVAESADTENATITVQGVTHIAETEDSFVCATLDWWPENKCDYNQCPWGKAGIGNLDLGNKILSNAIKAFNPLRIRIGGSIQDQVVYKVGRFEKCPKCPYFKKKKDGLFGFGPGCLSMQKWDELNNLFHKTGAKIIFGLNALRGRKKSSDGGSLWVGDWDPQNARDLMAYTISKGYKIDSYELGNELCGGGVAARVEAEQYAEDTIALRQLVNELYPDPNTRPKVLGPGGFYDKKWFDTYLQASGPGVLDAVTHHTYNLGAGVDPKLIDRVQDPFYLSECAQTYKDASNSVKEFGPWADAWVGEAGGAYNSGGKDVSHTFANGFWYLDQLGMTSTFNHKVFCRQALIGGNYALLNTTSFIPNPDYYGALLWHRLMGKKVLRVKNDGSPYLRVYAHCSKQHKGITVLIINLSKSTTFHVSIVDDLNIYPKKVGENSQREEYRLTPKDGSIQSDVVLLNGTPLQLSDNMDIPKMNPVLVDPKTPIEVGSRSIIFATLNGFKAPTCA